jgi:hypothetical protein
MLHELYAIIILSSTVIGSVNDATIFIGSHFPTIVSGLGHLLDHLILGESLEHYLYPRMFFSELLLI